MRGDRTAYVLVRGDVDWQGDPTGEPDRELIANDCALIPSVNKDNGSLVAGEALLVIFPGAKRLPEPEDEIEVKDKIGDEGVWQIDGDIAHFTKSGSSKAWMFNVRKQR